MAGGIGGPHTAWKVTDLDPEVAIATTYDLGAWAAGYEARSAWLIGSRFCPQRVSNWYRIEFVEERRTLSAPKTLAISFGALLGENPGHRNWDGYWFDLWHRTLAHEHLAAGRPIRVFVDYSSMPRTVYGTLLLAAAELGPTRVEAITFAYVPGNHASGVHGSRSIEGLRTLIGTEGAVLADQAPAFILGLGYDGILAQSILEMFQVTSYSCLYAAPGAKPDSVSRTLEANRSVLSRAEMVATAPASSPGAASIALLRLRQWFHGRDVIAVPLGPKTHVLGALLSTISDRTLAVRFPKTGVLTPVEVTVDEQTVPIVSRVSFERPMAP